MKCFGVDEVNIFEPKAKNTFPSFRTQRSIKLPLFPFFRSLLFKAEASVYVMTMMILCMSKWMFMNANVWCNVSCKWMFKDTYKTTIKNSYSLRNNKFLSFIFWLHRLFFGVSALTFRCKFCIPLGTSFELLRLLLLAVSRWLFALRLILWRNQRWLFAVSSAFP
jgi:hypothetical protein